MNYIKRIFINIASEIYIFIGVNISLFRIIKETFNRFARGYCFHGSFELALEKEELRIEEENQKLMTEIKIEKEMQKLQKQLNKFKKSNLKNQIKKHLDK